MSVLSLGMVAGGCLALAVVLLIAYLRPAPIALSATGRGTRKRRPLPTTIDTSQRFGTADAAIAGFLGRRLGPHAVALRLPLDDLAVLQRPVEQHLLQQAGWAVGVLLGGPMLLAFYSLLSGVAVPVAIPVVVIIAAALAATLIPTVQVHAAAESARTDMRSAVASYLDLVALQRLAGGAPTDALQKAATIGNSWAFVRMRRQLDVTRLSGATQWQALSALGADMGVTELEDVGSIVAVASDDGASIVETLTAKGRAMRGASLDAQRSDAEATTRRMTLPGFVLFAGFLVFLLYPTLTTLFSS